MNQEYTPLSDVEVMKQAVRDHEVTAFLPLAEALAESGHPYAEELVELALMIVYEESAFVSCVSMNAFIAYMDLPAT